MAQPEISIAKRLIKLRKLVPPIDIFALAQEFASIEALEFPLNLDVDGVCLNVNSFRRAKILINTYARTRQRIRFTLAHELGHVLIPWHNGSIADDYDVSYGEAELEYRAMEGEANRFATELLMPTEWVQEITQAHSSPVQMSQAISVQGDVSYHAAVIRLSSMLPRGYVY